MARNKFPRKSFNIGRMKKKEKKTEIYLVNIEVRVDVARILRQLSECYYMTLNRGYMSPRR